MQKFTLELFYGNKCSGVKNNGMIEDTKMFVHIYF